MIDKAAIADPKTRYGTKGHGTRLFKLQRLTGAINLAALLFFIWFVLRLAGAERAEMLSLVANPFVAVPLAILIVSVTIHMRVGMLEVIEDYVDEHSKNRLASTLNTAFSALVALLALGSIAKIVFWG